MLTAGTIRKVQRKAIAIHQNYISQLEAATAKSKSALDEASAKPLLEPMDAKDIDMDDDLCIALGNTEDVGSSVPDDPSDMPETDLEDYMDSNELKISEEVREQLLQVRKEILGISQQ